MMPNLYSISSIIMISLLPIIMILFLYLKSSFFYINSFRYHSELELTQLMVTILLSSGLVSFLCLLNIEIHINDYIKIISASIAPVITCVFFYLSKYKENKNFFNKEKYIYHSRIKARENLYVVNKSLVSDTFVESVKAQIINNNFTNHSTNISVTVNGIDYIVDIGMTFDRYYYLKMRNHDFSYTGGTYDDFFGDHPIVPNEIQSILIKRSGVIHYPYQLLTALDKSDLADLTEDDFNLYDMIKL